MLFVTAVGNHLYSDKPFVSLLQMLLCYILEHNLYTTSLYYVAMEPIKLTQPNNGCRPYETACVSVSEATKNHLLLMIISLPVGFCFCHGCVDMSIYKKISLLKANNVSTA